MKKRPKTVSTRLGLIRNRIGKKTRIRLDPDPKHCYNIISIFRYRAYGDPTVELPWSEVTAISNEVTQYVLKDLNPGDQFEIQVFNIL